MANGFIDQSGLQHYSGIVKGAFVAKETGKGLSSNDYTSTEKSKLSGIEAGAEVNVLEAVKVNGTALTIDGNKAVNITVPTKTTQLTNDSGFITIEQVPEGAVASSTVPKMSTTSGALGSESAYARGDHAHPSDTSKVDKTTTINSKALSGNITLSASDVGAVPTGRTVNGKALSTNISLSYSDVGAAEAEHSHSYAGSSSAGGAATTALACTGNSATATALKTAQKITVGNKEHSFDGSTAINFSLSDIGAIATSAKGVANGVATLGSDGKIPSSQLPSYVDDVVEGYYYNGKFYEESSHSTEIVAMTSKIYVDLATNICYRYGGSTYVEITSADMVALTNEEIDAIFASA